jgi:hypothetical protein
MFLQNINNIFCQDIPLPKDMYRDRIVSEIYCEQVSILGNEYPFKSYSTVFSSWYKELDFSMENDTIFLLENFSNEGNNSILCWSKRDTILCEAVYLQKLANNVPINIEVYDYFIHNPIIYNSENYILGLVSKWDIAEIRKKEEKNGTLDGCIYYATRIIFFDKKYKIDFIHFEDFIE